MFTAYREHTCPYAYCRERGTYSHITEVHVPVCTRRPIPCSNSECTEEVTPQRMKRHLDKCPHTPVPCKFARLGCNAMPRRTLIETHEEDDTLHLRMAINTITRLMEERESVTLRSGESVTFKITKYSGERNAMKPSLLLAYVPPMAITWSLRSNQMAIQAYMCLYA